MKPTRRQVVCGLCAGAVACTGPAGTLPTDDTDVDTDLDTDDTDVPWSPCVDPGTAAEGWTRIDLASHPELADVGGFIYLRLENRDLAIAHVEPGCFVAVTRACTHEGVLVEFNSNRFICPRHGAQYRWDGSVIAGPAPRSLGSFPCGVRDDALWVLLS